MSPYRASGTLIDYARAAVDLKTRMNGYCGSDGGAGYLQALMQGRYDKTAEAARTVPQLRRVADGLASGTDEVATTLARLTRSAWRLGEAYVLAPAMTAIVAAAADALDLSGEALYDDAAPADFGVLYLPEPIYLRYATGTVGSYSAITWARYSAGTSSSWCVAGWYDPDDPHSPEADGIRRQLRKNPKARKYVGPMMLSDFDSVRIGVPQPAVDHQLEPQGEQDWQPGPDGKYVIDAAACRTRVCTAIVYAFWRIQAQPLATVATAPPDETAQRRAVRSGIIHGTRIVMLRRVSTVDDGTDGEARWHYRVRFMVRGHWRKLTDRNGNPYRVWIHSFIKGPDGAPLLHGEKVAVLAR